MSSEKTLTGQVLEDYEMVSIVDLCRSCTVELETVTLLVEEGILDPVGTDVTHWQFTVTSLRRVKTAIHLQRDLGVKLLDRIAELERN